MVGGKSLKKEWSILGKRVDTFKRDMAVTPLRPVHREKAYLRA